MTTDDAKKGIFGALSGLGAIIGINVSEDESQEIPSQNVPEASLPPPRITRVMGEPAYQPAIQEPYTAGTDQDLVQQYKEAFQQAIAGIGGDYIKFLTAMIPLKPYLTGEALIKATLGVIEPQGVDKNKVLISAQNALSALENTAINETRKLEEKYLPNESEIKYKNILNSIQSLEKKLAEENLAKAKMEEETEVSRNKCAMKKNSLNLAASQVKAEIIEITNKI